MTRAELYEWMDDPSLLTKSSLQDLRQMIEEYPYFHAARMLYLKNLAVLQDVRLQKELKKMSIYIPDRRLLYKLINERIPAVERKETVVEQKETVVEQKEAVVEQEEAVVKEPVSDEKVPVTASKPISSVAAVTSDYVNWLAQQAEDLPVEEGADNRLKHQDLIDSFIAIESNQLAQRLSKTAAGNMAEKADDDSETFSSDPMEKISLDDSYFTETLARVYVNQRRYDKALEIIRVLSLKYPQKNRYFADQIRYLEKIINIKK